MVMEFEEVVQRLLMAQIRTLVETYKVANALYPACQRIWMDLITVLARDPSQRTKLFSSRVRALSLRKRTRDAARQARRSERERSERPEEIRADAPSGEDAVYEASAKRPLIETKSVRFAGEAERLLSNSEDSGEFSDSGSDYQVSEVDDHAGAEEDEEISESGEELDNEFLVEPTTAPAPKRRKLAESSEEIGVGDVVVEAAGDADDEDDNDEDEEEEEEEEEGVGEAEEEEEEEEPFQGALPRTSFSLWLTLAILSLGCRWIRERYLVHDLVRWAQLGELPYLNVKKVAMENEATISAYGRIIRASLVRVLHA